MAKKKGKASGKKSTWQPKPPSEDPVLMRPPPDRFITVHIRGATWSVLDFTVRLPGSKRVVDLRTAISARHGDSVTGLVLYKDEIHARNLLSDMMMSRLDSLVAPAVEDRGIEAQLIICYEFQTHTSECPLLLSAPHNLKIEAHHQKYQYQQPRGGLGARNARPVPTR